MCIAILKTKEATITDEVLRTCYNNNKDGCGFAYCENKTVYIKKFMNFDRFLEEYKKVEGKSNMLIHFRIATHGGVNVDNCHPFILNDRMALIHNGIIAGYGDKTNKSDTRDFIDKVIGNISHRMWRNPSFRELVGNAIGYSKFCILDTDDNYYIINEHKGEWVDGVWYSNTSYKPKVVYSSAKTCSNNTTNYKNYYGYYECDFYGLDLVFRCKDCGEEFTKKEGKSLLYACPKCHKYNTEEVGWIQDGLKYYYYGDEDKKENKKENEKENKKEEVKTK